jgi:AraC-like DNA-binding protein
MSKQTANLLTGSIGQRGHDLPPDTLPLLLRTATHGTISQGRFNPSWSKRYFMAKWLIRGEGAMRIGGRQIPLRPGDVSIYTPTIPHDYWAIAPISEMCWFTMDGPLCEQFIHLLGLRPGVYPYGDAPVSMIRKMIAALRHDTLDARLKASALGIRMLYDLVERIPPQNVSTVVQKVKHLIQEGLNDPSLSVSAIAAKLGHNRSSLSLSFHRQTGATIMQCITRARLQEAEMLLIGGEERIRDIATKCGFRDAAYFSRWIKKHTGRIPRDLQSPE